MSIRGRLSGLADDVLAGRVDRADAAVAGQLLGTVVRAIATELKVKEQLEILERLEVLETQTQEGNQKGGRAWGA